MITKNDIIKNTTRLMLEDFADERFSLETLSSLPSFRQRVMYCKQYLGRQLGSGSSRMTFAIDNEKCLKLAKNAKGIAQNIAEGQPDYYKDAMSIFPEKYENDSEYLWIVCERVRPATVNDFKQQLGVTFREFQLYTELIYSEYARYGMYAKSQEAYDKFYEMMENDDTYFWRELYDYMTNYQIPNGDVARKVNWGVADRDGTQQLVLLDSGLNDDVMRNYYMRQ